MRKRLLAIVLLIIFTISVIVGCSSKIESESTSHKTAEEKVSSSEEKVSPNEDEEKPAEENNKQKSANFTLYTYYADAGKATIDSTLVALKEIYPNVNIEVEHRTDSDGSVLKTRAAVGELPDIIECVGELADAFAESGDIVPLDDILEKNNFFDKWIDGAFDGKQHSDGHYYAIQPNDPNCFVVLYNKQVFADSGLEEPKNYDEFMNVVTTLKSNDIIPLALFAVEAWPGLQLFDLAVIAEGEPLGITGRLEDGTTKISDEAYVKAANKIYDLVKAGLIGSGAFNTNASQAYELLKTGRAGMFVNGAWAFNDIKEYGDNIGYFNYNPFADAGKEDFVRWNMSGGAPSSGGYAVSANCSDIELAKEVLLEFLIQREKIESRDLGSLCLLVEEVQPKEPRFEAYQEYAESIANFKTFTKYSWTLNAEVLTILEDSVQKLLTGTYPPETFIAETEQQISQALSN